MFNMFAALQQLAEQRGDGLLPELADRLRKMPPLCEGHMTRIDGDAGDRTGEKDVDKSEERRKQRHA
jgi:hypothetical protein